MSSLTSWFQVRGAIVCRGSAGSPPGKPIVFDRHYPEERECEGESEQPGPSVARGERLRRPGILIALDNLP
jgi:hypothetical protein